MFRKSLYPLTDWNWLKFPLASVVIGALLMVVGVAAFVNAGFHAEHPDASVSSLVIAMLGLYSMMGLLYCACSGYLLRVARQPQSDQPLKLPNWSNPGILIKEGFLANFAYLLILYALMFALCIPSVFIGVLSSVTGLGAQIAQSGVLTLLTITGTALVALAVMVVLYIWLVFFMPLLMVRYAYTGKIKDTFSPRWAWRAVAIAPISYIGRSSAWSIYLAVITILTPLTAGFAYIIGMLIMPLALVNVAYLVGDYYATYLDD